MNEETKRLQVAAQAARDALQAHRGRGKAAVAATAEEAAIAYYRSLHKDPAFVAANRAAIAKLHS